MALEPAGLTWLNENLGAFISDIQKANRAIASVGEEAGRAGGGFSLLGSVVSGVAAGLTLFAVSAVSRATKALIDLGSTSVGVAADFQTMTVQLRQAGAQSRETADAVGGFGEIALRVGADTRLIGVSASGAAQAMTSLLKSGLSLTDVMGDVNAYMREGAELGGALRASIDLAAATELDMVQASELAVIVMSTFGKSAEEVTGAMDYMVRAADASVATVSELGMALTNIGPIAAAAGISFEDINIALALLASRGIRGAEAGTALRSMLANLRRPTESVKEELKKWNIALYDATGAMYPLPKILEQFQEALAGATQEERDLAIQTVAGTYGMNAMNALLSAGSQGWNEMARSIAGATSMSEKAAAHAQTFAGQLEMFEGVVESLRIRIGSAFLPALTKVLGVFSSLIEKYGPSITAVFERVGSVLAEFFDDLGQAMEGGWPQVEALLSEWGGRFWNWLTGPGGAMEKGANLISRLASGISGWLSENWPVISARLSEWAQRFWDWVETEAVPRAREKLTAVSEAIRAWSESPQARASLSMVGESLGRALAGGILALLGAVEFWTPIMVDVGAAMAEAAYSSILPAMRKASESVATGFARGFAEKLGIELPQETAKTIGKVSTLAIPAISAPTLGREFVENFRTSWRALGKIIRGEPLDRDLKKAIFTPFGVTLRQVEDETRSFSRTMVGHSIIPDMMQSMEMTFRASLSSILSNWSASLSLLRQTSAASLDFVLKTALSFASPLSAAGKSLAGSLISGFSALQSTFLSSVSNLLSSVLGQIQSTFSSFQQSGRSLVQSLASGLSAAQGTVLSAISQIMSGISAVISASPFVQAGQGIVSRIASGINSAWSSVYSTLSSLAAGLTGAVSGAGGAIAANIVNGIRSGLTAFWGGVTGLLSTLASGLVSVVDWAGRVAAAGARIVDGIIAGIQANWSRFVNWLKNAIAGIFGASEPTNPLSPFRSPRLFETGYRIGEALVKGMQEGMAKGFVMPTVPLNPAPVSRSMTVTIGPISVSSQMDAEIFAQRVRQVVANAI